MKADFLLKGASFHSQTSDRSPGNQTISKQFYISCQFLAKINTQIDQWKHTFIMEKGEH